MAFALFEGFCGPAYESRSRTVSSDRLVNLYLEKVETGLGKDKFAMYGRPGNAIFSPLNGGTGQGLIETQGRCFAVAGGRLYEIFDNGTWSAAIGIVGTSDPVSMATNHTQLIITSARGGGWVLPLNNYAGYAQILSPGFPVPCDSVTYQDTYFIATRQDTQEFSISAPNDGTSWSGLDFASKEGFSDNIRTVQMIRRQLWVFGEESSEIWWNSGQANFPFAPVQGALVMTGMASQRSNAIVGNSLFWLGRSARGEAVAYTEQNFSPVRVSNHALEAAWSKYPTIADAIGYGLEMHGHAWYVLSFPQAQATWVLDTKSGFWQEWDWWNSIIGGSEAFLARYHCFCFKKHLTLDWKQGNIYELAMDTYTDAGGLIRRVRRFPHVDKLKRRVRHVALELDIETGSVPLTGLGSNPKYSLKYSDDGGFTWGNELIRYVGKTGRHAEKVVWRQLGSSYDRVYELESDEPIAHSWSAAYLDTA